MASEHLTHSPDRPLMSLQEIYPNASIQSGKVRDRIDFGDTMLMFASDRISVFDVVLPTGIPQKGQILTEMSSAWTDFLGVPNDVISDRIEDFPKGYQDTRLADRTTLVRKGQMAKVECIARGYITGSMWEAYKKSGDFMGHDLPSGLVESQKLPEPIFTPSTKEEEGHDINIYYPDMLQILRMQFPQHDAKKLAESLRDSTLDYYNRAAQFALSRGIIIADTKFEFYVNEDGSIGLGDEKLTPDSSRFWPEEDYEPGRSQKSFDKQFVRDYTASQGWGKTYPGPELPLGVVEQTVEKYREAQRRLFG